MTTPRYRTGRSIGRTIYRVNEDGSEEPVGMLDTAGLAQEFVDAMNARLAGQDGLTGWFMTNDEKVRGERVAHQAGRQLGMVEGIRKVSRALAGIEQELYEEPESA